MVTERWEIIMCCKGEKHEGLSEAGAVITKHPNEMLYKSVIKTHIAP